MIYGIINSNKQFLYHERFCMFYKIFITLLFSSHLLISSFAHYSSLPDASSSRSSSRSYDDDDNNRSSSSSYTYHSPSSSTSSSARWTDQEYEEYKNQSDEEEDAKKKAQEEEDAKNRENDRKNDEEARLKAAQKKEAQEQAAQARAALLRTYNYTFQPAASSDQQIKEAQEKLHQAQAQFQQDKSWREWCLGEKRSAALAAAHALVQAQADLIKQKEAWEIKIEQDILAGLAQQEKEAQERQSQEGSQTKRPEQTRTQATVDTSDLTIVDTVTIYNIQEHDTSVVQQESEEDFDDAPAVPPVKLSCEEIKAAVIAALITSNREDLVATIDTVIDCDVISKEDADPLDSNQVHSAAAGYLILGAGFGQSVGTGIIGAVAPIVIPIAAGVYTVCVIKNIIKTYFGLSNSINAEKFLADQALSDAREVFKQIDFDESKLDHGYTVQVNYGYCQDPYAVVVIVTDWNGHTQPYVKSVDFGNKDFQCIDETAMIPGEFDRNCLGLLQPGYTQSPFHVQPDSKKSEQRQKYKGGKKKDSKKPKGPKKPNSKTSPDKATGDRKEVPDWSNPKSVEFYESLKANTSKKAHHNKFGNLYKDPKTDLWWSKDTAGHSGPHYKVFKETAEGLLHQFDADLLGSRIPKHKGSVGCVLKWKDVFFKS